MLLDRKRAVGRYLEWKVRLFVVAAVVGLAGIATENRWATGAAIVILMGGLLLRFLPDPDDRGADGED